MGGKLHTGHPEPWQKKAHACAYTLFLSLVFSLFVKFKVPNSTSQSSRNDS